MSNNSTMALYRGEGKLDYSNNNCQISNDGFYSSRGSRHEYQIFWFHLMIFLKYRHQTRVLKSLTNKQRNPKKILKTILVTSFRNRNNGQLEILL